MRHSRPIDDQHTKMTDARGQPIQVPTGGGVRRPGNTWQSNVVLALRSCTVDAMSLITWCRRAVFDERSFVLVLVAALILAVVFVPTGFVSADSAGAVVGAPRENMSAIAAGRGHTCAIVTAGQVVCWGDDTFGQLGNGANTGLVDGPGVPIVLFPGR